MTPAPLILCDVDGVLGSFNEAFLALLNAMHGRNQQFGPDGPTVWEWPTEELGFTGNEVSCAWRTIDAEQGYFWRHDVKALPGSVEALRRLSLLDYTGGANVYFVTARRTSCARRRTAEWLVNAGYDGHPAVITTGLKGKLAKVLKKRDQRTIVIDDKPENLADCAASGAKLYLIDHAYNKWCDYAGIVRVGSVLEALQLEFAPQTTEVAA